MNENVLSVRERGGVGKSYARKLRKAGRTPAIAYTEGNNPIHFEMIPGDLLKILRRKGKNTLLTLTFEDQAHGDQTAMLRELQREPVSRDILHADFALVDESKLVRVNVHLSFDGRPIGLVRGGIADVIRRDLEVECLPRDIPQVIHVDVTELDLNMALHVGDVSLPEGVTAVDDEHFTLVTISAPADMEEEEKDEEEEEEEEVA